MQIQSVYVCTGNKHCDTLEYFEWKSILQSDYTNIGQTSWNHANPNTLQMDILCLKSSFKKHF